MLGASLGRIGRLKEAAQYFSKAVMLEPDSAENHDNLAAVLIETGQLLEAIRHLNKALEIDNSYEPAEII